MLDVLPIDRSDVLGYPANISRVIDRSSTKVTFEAEGGAEIDLIELDPILGLEVIGDNVLVYLRVRPIDQMDRLQSAVKQDNREECDRSEASTHSSYLGETLQVIARHLLAK